MFSGVPEFGRCLWQGHTRPGLGASDLTEPLHLFQINALSFGRRIANRRCGLVMLGEQTNIPTDTLIDMIYVILAAEVAITARDAGEIEQIQDKA